MENIVKSDGKEILNTAYKILATVINNRLTTYAEDLLCQEQNGFRRNSSTMDSIFIMRQILEKCYEYNIEMHVLLVLSRILTLLIDKKPYRYCRNWGYQISWYD